MKILRTSYKYGPKGRKEGRKMINDGGVFRFFGCRKGEERETDGEEGLLHCSAPLLGRSSATRHSLTPSSLHSIPWGI